MSDGHITFSRCSAHSTKEALSLNAGPALWWRAMSDAAAAGDASFNCGITWVGDAGLLKWKEAWGGQSRPVHIHVLPLRARAPAASGYFEGYTLAKTIWKRLPLPIVDHVGHQVTRWIG
jgi:lipid II:glycine glycyltransferase (peptidoglycan interpeptide bridge formation enzyme)